MVLILLLKTMYKVDILIPNMNTAFRKQENVKIICENGSKSFEMLNLVLIMQHLLN